jgi:hypothetical protein
MNPRNLAAVFGWARALHLKMTGQTAGYLASLMRLSEAYIEIRQMPQHQDKAQLVDFYCALADKVRQSAGDAQSRVAEPATTELGPDQGLGEPLAQDLGELEARIQSVDASMSHLPLQGITPEKTDCPPRLGPTGNSPGELWQCNHPLRCFSMEEARRRGLA